MLTKTDVIGISLFLVLGSCVFQAKAEVRLGAGVNCGISVGDGNWEQQGASYSREDCGQAFSLQHTGTALPWLDYMAGLSYRKGTSVSGGDWVSDDCYRNRKRSGGPSVVWFDGAPKSECDVRWYTNNIEVHSHSLSLALVPTYRGKDFSLFTSLGFSYFKSFTKIDWAVATWPDGKHPIHKIDHYEKSGFSPYLDFGGTYKQVFMTVYYVPGEKSPESPNSGNYGAILGVRF